MSDSGKLNQGQQVELRIPSSCQDWTIESFFKAYGRSVPWRDLLDAGKIHLNGAQAKAETMIKVGDHVSFFREPWVEPNWETAIAMIYRESEIMVVDKPAGIPVTASGPFLENTVLSRLSHRLDIPDLSPLHRLDLETSGVLALATVPESRAFYQRQFADQSVQKSYLALVHGRIEVPRTISLPLGPAKNSRIHTKMGWCANGKACQTHIEPIEPWGPFTLIRVKPRTGRRNQIRAHLALIGHHIVGDKKYDPDETVFLRWLEHHDTALLIHSLVLCTQALHAQSITLRKRDDSLLEVRSQIDVVEQWREAVASRLT